MPSRISQMRNEQILPQQTRTSQPMQKVPQINEDYLNSIKAMMRSKNSQQLLANLAAQNPQVQQLIQLLQNSNNPQGIFEMIARERGVDPVWLINYLMS